MKFLNQLEKINSEYLSLIQEKNTNTPFFNECVVAFRDMRDCPFHYKNEEVLKYWQEVWFSGLDDLKSMTTQEFKMVGLILDVLNLIQK